MHACRCIRVETKISSSASSSVDTTPPVTDALDKSEKSTSEAKETATAAPRKRAPKPTGRPGCPVGQPDYAAVLNRTHSKNITEVQNRHFGYMRNLAKRLTHIDTLLKQEADGKKLTDKEAAKASQRAQVWGLAVGVWRFVLKIFGDGDGSTWVQT